MLGAQVPEQLTGVGQAASSSGLELCHKVLSLVAESVGGCLNHAPSHMDEPGSSCPGGLGSHPSRLPTRLSPPRHHGLSGSSGHQESWLTPQTRLKDLGRNTRTTAERQGQPHALALGHELPHLYLLLSTGQELESQGNVGSHCTFGKLLTQDYMALGLHTRQQTKLSLSQGSDVLCQIIKTFPYTNVKRMVA